MQILESKYNNHIRKEKIKISNDTIDFIGINIDIETEKYCVKTYYAPISCLKYSPNMTNKILSYTTKNEMNRFFWIVRDEIRIREYIALKNRTNRNMSGLYELLEQYSYIKKNISEIKRMSEMKFTDKSNNKYASLYILGIKGEKEEMIINFEWFTRKCPDPDDAGYMYKYDDIYFLDYLDKIDIHEYNILSKMARKLLSIYNLHLWCFASDYFPDMNVKHKIYFKGELENISFKEICEVTGNNVKESIINELDGFKKYHNELKLYGFAFCMDSNGKFSINSYYRLKQGVLLND